jgi:hypothetical protein
MSEVKNPSPEFDRLPRWFLQSLRSFSMTVEKHERPAEFGGPLAQ